MNIDLCFQGWLEGVEIERVFDNDRNGIQLGVVHGSKTLDARGASGLGGKQIQIVTLETWGRVQDPKASYPVKPGEVLYTLTTKQFLEKLQNGAFTISLSSVLDKADNSEIEIFDFADASRND